MLSCRRVTELCSRELDAPLRVVERVSMWRHLRRCDGCTRFRVQMSTLRTATRAYADGRGPDGDPSGGDGPAGGAPPGDGGRALQ